MRGMRQASNRAAKTAISFQCWVQESEREIVILLGMFFFDLFYIDNVFGSTTSKRCSIHLLSSIYLYKKIGTYF